MSLVLQQWRHGPEVGTSPSHSHFPLTARWANGSPLLWDSVTEFRACSDPVFPSNSLGFHHRHRLLAGAFSFLASDSRQHVSERDSSPQLHLLKRSPAESFSDFSAPSDSRSHSQYFTLTSSSHDFFSSLTSTSLCFTTFSLLLFLFLSRHSSWGHFLCCSTTVWPSEGGVG